ncbi:MAG: DUF2085 domain-containing protein [Candidatus Korobacteraceae bacterium]
MPHSRPGFGLEWGLWLRPNPWAAAALTLAVAAVSVPYFFTHNFLLIAFPLQHSFALVCHQRPERSFWIFGAPVAVCARCLGIYLGAAIGLLFRTSRRVATQLLIAAAILNLLDVVTEFAGLHGNWMALRFALGAALGAAGGLLISSATTSAVVDLRVPDC